MSVTRTKDTRNERAVCADVLSNGYFVSTVNLDEPLINTLDNLLGDMFSEEGRADLSTPGSYETMVFRCAPDGSVDDWIELDFARYPTEGEAREGHEAIVAKWMTT